ncbi:hypothetical protein PTTG_10261 [Puccinia triticina 1-1 BBBD Race 1]|uniref:Uncharacterized protein n=1 Tax=Puccinia triticina (isolate 1-1 / race 1 (BBBD)) TaxID=630390 RepID=A0A0C4FAL8_PUCT1|nr:hypothetical protein PTTG_10261 [Puccinia triticina 1-1 BBBD Race 1]
MNIPEWTAALSKWGLLPQYADVLHGFKHGFDQGIPEHTVNVNLPYYTPPNHDSALQARNKNEESMEKEIRAKRMYGPFTHEEVNKHFKFFRTSPLGAVINGDGSLRLINDLSFPHDKRGIPSVNSFVSAEDFTTT